MTSKAGLYIHIPFCQEKCYYCDFLSYPRQEKRIDPYLEDLYREMEIEGRRGFAFDSVYIGGGSPGHLGGKLVDILDKVKENFLIDEDSEISLEMNPGDLDEETLLSLKDLGLNRLSLGVQTFSEDRLKLLNRKNDLSDVYDSVDLIRKVGIENISFDLMAGIPDQTLEDLKEDLKRAISLNPDHISYYSLIIEENTYFHRLYKEGRLNEADEDLVCEMIIFLNESLEDAGYHHYEVSNYAKRGKESRHNIKYWTYAPYIGLGLGAASFFDKKRIRNARTFRSYRDQVISLNEEKREVEEISYDESVFEYTILKMRMTEGVNLRKFEGIFGKDIFYFYEAAIEKHLDRGNIEIVDGFLRFTKQGMLYSNLFYLDL